MKVKYEYSGKTFFITPYKTDIEKDILVSMHLEAATYDSVLDLLGVDEDTIDSLTTPEKIAMLYKYRAVSVGETIPLKYSCIHCKHPNDAQIEIDNIVKSSDINDDKIKDAFKIPTQLNIQEFLNVDVDELDFDEYENILENVRNCVTRFDFIKTTKCIKCRKENKIDITQNVIDNMSEDSLVSMYQTYNDLTFFGKYSKRDIDTLYPFERAILIGLLNKTREDLAK